jgi:rare lipoprotein A
MIRYLLILLLLLPCAVNAAPAIERDDLTDAQLLEVLAQDGDMPKDPQIGVATYYASRFIGRRTTSGQRYHPDKMTAAHALLPLGTMVTVANIKSGQKVSVIINDRCHPRHAVRNLIDLSRAAAQQIGLWGKGAIKVRIVPLEKKNPLDELLDEGKG